jgi:hypothetical protein
MKKRKTANACPSGIDKTALSTAPLHSGSDIKAYWLSVSPHERLRQVEILRRINYGRRATARLSRVLEIAHLKINKKASGRHRDLDDLEHLP